MNPGRILPGILGLAAVGEGTYHVCHCSPSAAGTIFFGLGALLCIIHALTGKNGTAILAIAAVSLGGWTLFPRSGTAVRIFVTLVALLLGSGMTFLLSTAHAGYRLKRSSL
jgi:membrane-bound ClpP family serine protease